MHLTSALGGVCKAELSMPLIFGIGNESSHFLQFRTYWVLLAVVENTETFPIY